MNTPKFVKTKTVIPEYLHVGERIIETQYVKDKKYTIRRPIYPKKVLKLPTQDIFNELSEVPSNQFIPEIIEPETRNCKWCDTMIGNGEFCNSRCEKLYQKENPVSDESTGGFVKIHSKK